LGSEALNIVLTMDKDREKKKLKKKKPKKERQGDADTFEKEPLIRENVDEEQAQQRPQIHVYY